MLVFSLCMRSTCTSIIGKFQLIRAQVARPIVLVAK